MVPTPDTEVRMIARTSFVLFVITSSSFESKNILCACWYHILVLLWEWLWEWLQKDDLWEWTFGYHILITRENYCKNLFSKNISRKLFLIARPRPLWWTLWGWSTLKRKKARVLPMKEEDMFIAQKTPELRVIVVGSELFANRFPWVTITNGGLHISCKFKVRKGLLVT